MCNVPSKLASSLPRFLKCCCERLTMQKFNFLSKNKKKLNCKLHDTDNASTVSETKLISRNALICSSGKDKYQFDSERADLPTRPVNMELEAGGAISPHLLSVNSINSDHLSSSNRSLCTSLDQSSMYRENSCVPRESIVKRFDLQPSICANGRFLNPWPSWHAPTFTNLVRFAFSTNKSKIPSKAELNQALPLVVPSINSECAHDSIRITWIGHATVLVQFDNICVLTDPIFSERASPSQVIGPKRYRDPPCSIHDLPSNLDAVVISHSHYDHLDLNTVVMLNARFGNDLRWFIPLGLSDWFNSVGVENVVELDWWEENCVPDKSDVSFIFTPAQHWSKRTPFDTDKSLWGGWIVKGPKHKFYFAGDTGYCEVFKQIGKAYGPFDVAAIPIGAYEPNWFMKPQHVNPAEAVKIHKDVRSQFSLAIHWGTFALANEYFLEPPEKLKEALKKSKISTNKFVAFMHGETRIISSDRIVTSLAQARIE